MSRLLALLAMLIVSCRIQVCPAATLDKLKESWKLYMQECDHNNSQHPPSTGLVCNRTFDNYACWPDGLPNTIVNVPCPWYLPWYHKEAICVCLCAVQHGMVYQECDANGQWVTTKNTSECDSNNLHQQYYGHIRIMYTVGYSLSLVALVLALGILIFFRKLHCMRNNIHMNLFASFILRALSILIKDALLDANITSQGLSRDQEQGFSQASIPPVELLVNNETTISCRIAVAMMQYSIMANSYWLLVEGIYLHNLLVITVFTERKYFNIYLCIGWGTPLIFLVPWLIAKYLYENQTCWEQNIDMNYWWIIRSPILLAVVGLLVAILYCFVNKEVQSEILKKWKRWKLGRNIEEEYRHTNSNTPNTKTGSLLNHVPRLPHLLDIAKTSAPNCSPEERHMLVSSCHNGMVHSKEEGQCTSLLHEGTISNCTLVEDIGLTAKVHGYEAQRGNVESRL
ncbi:glucagon receptor isoform X4 [Channa argus]|uniref:glucagon receptor isoform X4 n=1 Tax=Channa argus TaxID=215402 RepID=UPI00352260BA